MAVVSALMPVALQTRYAVQPLDRAVARSRAGLPSFLEQPDELRSRVHRPVQRLERLVAARQLRVAEVAGRNDVVPGK